MSINATETSNAKKTDEIYLDGTYLVTNETWHVEDSLWKAEQIKKILSENSIKPDTVCEVGCGAGEIVRQLSMAMPDSQFVGYELSPQAFELCKTRESGNVKYFLKNIFKEHVNFDVLLCIDVFEHVEDYFGFIRGLKSKAKFKVFHIPLDVSAWSVARGFMSANRKSAGHLHYYTRDSAIATLKDCGYKILDESYTLIFDHQHAVSWKRKIFQNLQRFFFKASPHLAVRLLGGCSLIVLTE